MDLCIHKGRTLTNVSLSFFFFFSSFLLLFFSFFLFFSFLFFCFLFFSFLVLEIVEFSASLCQASIGSLPLSYMLSHLFLVFILGQSLDKSSR